MKDKEKWMRTEEIISEISMEQFEQVQNSIITFLDKLVQGDIDAFEKVVELYQKKLFSIAYRLVGTVEDAKDIIQETFMKIYKNIHKLKNVKKPFPYFCRITINTCMDWLKKQRKSHIPFIQIAKTSQVKGSFSTTSPEYFMQQKEK